MLPRINQSQSAAMSSTGTREVPSLAPARLAEAMSSTGTREVPSLAPARLAEEMLTEIHKGSINEKVSKNIALIYGEDMVEKLSSLSPEDFKSLLTPVAEIAKLALNREKEFQKQGKELVHDQLSLAEELIRVKGEQSIVEAASYQKLVTMQTNYYIAAKKIKGSPALLDEFNKFLSDGDVDTLIAYTEKITSKDSYGFIRPSDGVMKLAERGFYSHIGRYAEIEGVSRADVIEDVFFSRVDSEDFDFSLDMDKFGEEFKLTDKELSKLLNDSIIKCSEASRKSQKDRFYEIGKWAISKISEGEINHCNKLRKHNELSISLNGVDGLKEKHIDKVLNSDRCSLFLGVRNSGVTTLMHFLANGGDTSSFSVDEQELKQESMVIDSDGEILFDPHLPKKIKDTIPYIQSYQINGGHVICDCSSLVSSDKKGMLKQIIEDREKTGKRVDIYFCLQRADVSRPAIRKEGVLNEIKKVIPEKMHIHVIPVLLDSVQSDEREVRSGLDLIGGDINRESFSKEMILCDPKVNKNVLSVLFG